MTLAVSRTFERSTPTFVSPRRAASIERNSGAVSRVKPCWIMPRRSAPNNPARWKDNLAHLLPEPGKVKQVRHHAALDWREALLSMADLTKRTGAAAKALALTM